jgi:hypothetical protein
MKRLLWKLTGGRPMVWIESLFVDYISGRTVSLYADRLGRRWMAEGRWALFRVERP